MELKELQEQLEGVYDLTNLVDCQSVIRMLLGDIDKANVRQQATEKNLKSLALMVKCGNPKAKDYAEDIFKGYRKPDQVWDMLQRMSREITAAEKLNDPELVSRVLSDVWGGFNMDSQESALLEELLRRFKICAEVTSEQIEEAGK